MENNTKSKKDRIYKLIIAVLFITIIILVWRLIVTDSKYNTIVVEKDLSLSRNQELQFELEGLLQERDSIKAEYGELSEKLSEKDSIISINAKEIQRLIASQADYRRIKKKLDYLRGIVQGYVSQIDSLYTVTKELKQENVKIKEDYKKEQVKNQELSNDKEQLTEKVTIASALKAYKVAATPIRLKSGNKEMLTDKAKKTEQIKVCFTLGENLITPKGLKNIYIRIARPDNYILIVSEEDTYSFTHQGKKIQYSMMKEINYDNKSMDLCLYWKKLEDFIPGTYSVSVFVDDYEVGQTTFELQ